MDNFRRKIDGEIDYVFYAESDNMSISAAAQNLTIAITSTADEEPCEWSVVGIIGDSSNSCTATKSGNNVIVRMSVNTDTTNDRNIEVQLIQDESNKIVSISIYQNKDKLKSQQTVYYRKILDFGTPYRNNMYPSMYPITYTVDVTDYNDFVLHPSSSYPTISFKSDKILEIYFKNAVYKEKTTRYYYESGKTEAVTEEGSFTPDNYPYNTRLYIKNAAGYSYEVAEGETKQVTLNYAYWVHPEQTSLESYQVAIITFTVCRKNPDYSISNMSLTLKDKYTGATFTTSIPPA